MINTCEAYVLKELEDAKMALVFAKQDAEKLKATIELKNSEIHYYQKLLDLFGNLIHFRKNLSGEYVISMDFLFEEFDKEDFDLLKEYYNPEGRRDEP